MSGETTLADTAGVTPETLADLGKATPASEIKQRQAYGKHGPINNPDGTPKLLDYVDARYVQDLLDEVVGPANWRTEFQDTHDGVRCTLFILVKGIGWVGKADAGVPSMIEPVKGAHSDAFKRAAVHWGIARDLYGGTPETEVDPTAAPTVRQQVGAGRTSRYAASAPTVVPDDEDDEDEEVPEWYCPLHGSFKIVPKGTSKKPPYRKYKAFFACDQSGCNEKGPSFGSLPA
jgi:hypothetical protein